VKVEVRSFILKILFLLIFNVSFYACIPATYHEPIDSKCRKNVKIKKIFRETYWNFYERGVSLSQAGCLDDATNDFHYAIRLWDRDGRLTPSYGMHFTEYFPNRELGIILFNKGDLVGAKAYLKSSIDSYPTAKAIYYRDEIRRKEIMKKSVLKGPDIQLDSKSLEIWTNQSKFIIRGKVFDKHFLSQVNISNKNNTNELFMRGTEKEFEFNHFATLQRGRNEFKIKAKNIADIVAEKTIIINADYSGPIISVKKEKRQDKNVTVFYNIEDNEGINDIEINKVKLSKLSDGLQEKLHKNCILMIKGELIENLFRIDEIRIKNSIDWTVPKKKWSPRDLKGKLFIAAYDKARNITKIEHTFKKENNSFQNVGNWTASLGQGEYPSYLAQMNNQTTIFQLKGFLKDAPLIPDKDKPILVYQDLLPISIEVKKNIDQFLRLKINQKTIIERTGNERYAKTEIVELDKGLNKFTITAYDSYKDIIQPGQKIIIERRELSMKTASFRPTLIVGDFKERDEDRGSEQSDAFETNLKSELDSLKINGIDRFIVKSKKDGAKGDFYLSGKIVNVGNAVEIVTSIFSADQEKNSDSKTKICEFDPDFYNHYGQEDMNIETIANKAAKSIANQILLEFPLLSGKIESKKGSKIKTDIKYRRPLTKRKLYVYNTNTFNNIHTKDSNLLATAEVVESKSKIVRAVIKSKKKNIDKGNQVIFQ
jgi:hypothetical protein